MFVSPVVSPVVCRPIMCDFAPGEKFRRCISRKSHSIKVRCQSDLQVNVNLTCSVADEQYECLPCFLSNWQSK